MAPFTLVADLDRPNATVPTEAVVCRRIRETDLAEAIVLLCDGFPERPSGYWARALDVLGNRPLPPGDFPRFGYVLAAGQRLVGIVLVIFTIDANGKTRGNVSSWYVDPPYRAFSPILLAAPMRSKNVTLINISPAPETIATIEAQGFKRYVDGTFHVMAALARRVPGAVVRRIGAESAGAPKLLRDHAALGCLAFEVEQGDECFPFVFVRCLMLGNRLPAAQLVYCREVEDFVRFAGPLGRALLRVGLPSVMLDANGPIAGLLGSYRGGRRPKFFRGEAPPRLGDLSETELTLFGF